MSPVRDDEMGTALPRTDYQCDQCGATNIVAASVIYSQGTHSFSGRFSAGTTQSSSARAAAPPRARGYFRPFLCWGAAAFILFLWTIVGLSSILQHPTTSALRPQTVALFLFIGIACFVAMVHGFRKVALYNREVYPRLYRDWEHTYVCKRCGRFQQIS